MRISHGVVPPGGWSYEDRGVVIYGFTFDELLTNVIAHRLSNGKDLDNVIDDIEGQISRKFPKLIIGGDYRVKKN